MVKRRVEPLLWLLFSFGGLAAASSCSACASWRSSTGRTCSVRYTLYYGLQLKHLSTPIILGCYGSALVGSVTAGYVLPIACKRQQGPDGCPPPVPPLPVPDLPGGVTSEAGGPQSRSRRKR